jgi:hypothetical protein
MRVIACVQLYMVEGRRGVYDEKVPVYPRAPVYSKEGCAFLETLSNVTHQRLTFSVSGPLQHKEFWWEKMRLRAPDAGRILWAMGKLRWKKKAVLKLAARVCTLDLLCPWNRPRYMTTAMWGAAWAYPTIALTSFVTALEKAPPRFWNGAPLVAGIDTHTAA